VQYTAEEAAFAQKIQATFNYQAPPIATADSVKTTLTAADAATGSTDVGDVSYAVPTVGLTAATWVPGTAAHSWQAVACGSNDIGAKGLMVAAKTIALTAIDLFTNPALIEKATQEYKAALGSYKYQALLGDRKPALNYRD